MNNKSLEEILGRIGKNLDNVLGEVKETFEKEILIPMEKKIEKIKESFEEKDSLKIKLDLKDYNIEKLSVKIDNKLKTIQVVLNESEEKVIKTVVFPEETELNENIKIYYRGKELVVELFNQDLSKINKEIIQIINH